MGQPTDGTAVEIEWRKDFDDHPAGGHASGQGTAAAIEGRCTNCWGRLVGRQDGDERWTGIECRLCGRSVEGDVAGSEMERMRREADGNLTKVCRGLAAKYREDAKFVFKILPDMDRNTAHVDKRIAAKIAAARRGGYLDRGSFPKGTAGYLYLQANTFMAGIESLPHEMSVIRYSDIDFEEPRISGVDVADDGSARVSAKTMGRFRQPSKHMLMERMGSVMMLGMISAFSCELALKAILITRQDEAKKNHDLLDLYKDLPEDSRTRLKADFAEIDSVLKDGRHTFGRWRYFEKNVDGKEMLAMVNTERAFALAKAARVIIDEGEIAGLTYKVNVNVKLGLDVDNGSTRHWAQYGLSVTSGEAAIPWDLLLTTGRGKRQ